MMSVDPSAEIAASARVHPEAAIGPGTQVGEFCVIEQDVVIGARCLLEPYVYVKRWTTMGDENEISAGTAFGTEPAGKSFTGQGRDFFVGGVKQKCENHNVFRGE